MKAILSSFVLVGLALGGAAYVAAQKNVAAATEMRTTKVRRGDLSRTITATGTVKLDQVEVGAQVTGRIVSFGSDPSDPLKELDCGSRVNAGMIVAKIDPTIYLAQVQYAQASLIKAKANFLQTQARLEQTEQDWKRAESLHRVKAISDADYDNAKTNFRMAEASVSVAKAAVQECEAVLQINQTNMNYTTITAPCNGIVLDRRVNVGQTVVASFNAPGLFLIAKESKQMQVWASIDETDIGSIGLGQPVRFTVSACNDTVFKGSVAQIRMNPTKRNDAITYTVVVAAEHRDGVLPDMTAHLQFEVERRPNVLLIPNDALQGMPESASTSSQPVAAGSSPQSEKALTQAEASVAARAARLWKERKANRHAWIRDGGLLRPVEVQLGASNGVMTEVTGGNVHEGMEIVLDGLCMKDPR